MILLLQLQVEVDLLVDVLSLAPALRILTLQLFTRLLKNRVLNTNQIKKLKNCIQEICEGLTTDLHNNHLLIQRLIDLQKAGENTNIEKWLSHVSLIVWQLENLPIELILPKDKKSNSLAENLWNEEADKYSLLAFDEHVLKSFHLIAELLECQSNLACIDG